MIEVGKGQGDGGRGCGLDSQAEKKAELEKSLIFICGGPPNANPDSLTAHKDAEVGGARMTYSMYVHTF